MTASARAASSARSTCAGSVMSVSGRSAPTSVTPAGQHSRSAKPSMPLLPVSSTRISAGPVRAAFRDQPARAQQALERARVRPPALQDAVGHGARGDVGVVDVRDLELAAPAGLERLDDAEDLVVVQVDADDREIAGRVLRLLDDAHDA